MNIKKARLSLLQVWLRLVWATGLVLGLLLLRGPAVPPAAADTVNDTIPAGGSPYAVAVNPLTNKVYEDNRGGSSLTVIEGTNNTGANSDWLATVQEDIRQSEYHVTWQERTYLANLPAAY